MNDRLQNGALAGLLVLTLVLVGFSLRSRGTVPASSDVAATPTSSRTASPSPTPTAASGPVVFLGDSVAEGRSATTPRKRWTAIVAGELGLKEVNLGHARTGYLRIGPEGSCGDAACPNFKDSVRAAAAAAPSAVVVTGGGNDTGLDAEAVASAVSATLTGLRKALPEAKIYVVNPWWDLREQPDSLDDLTTVVADAAKATGVTYLDTGQPLVGQPDLMVASGTNPNDAGHAALAKAVTEALASTPNG
ncbi:SGNH/GDSL hydrolase family protein [Knoellia locipacati]|uniref:SGNH/GDSL hydrolase family protein n=1 Tax=Knoellia locipacati TaxID=882824 RepID=UPI00384FDB89